MRIVESYAMKNRIRPLSMLFRTAPLRVIAQVLAMAQVLVVGQAAAADHQPPTELVVAKNQTYRVSAAQLQLKRLELQDGAVISFAPGINRALIHADHAIIGKGVRIDASGNAGAAGPAGKHWNEPAPACEAGKAGGDGAIGGTGGDGVDLIVELGVERIGSLRIDADGGAGGRGGNGGDGQRGGDLDRCYGKNGGDGGNGGTGGTGGNGGAVTLRYWVQKSDSQDSQQTASDLVSAFSLSVRGGNGGVGGSGGAGGGVVPGRYLSTSVGSGKKWLGAGEAGKPGSGGRAGNAGAAGSVSLMQQGVEAATVVPSVTGMQQNSGTLGAPAGKADGRDAEMRALRARIEALEERIRALESAR
jgi:hypothetical protein